MLTPPYQCPLVADEPIEAGRYHREPYRPKAPDDEVLDEAQYAPCGTAEDEVGQHPHDIHEGKRAHAKETIEEEVAQYGSEAPDEVLGGLPLGSGGRALCPWRALNGGRYGSLHQALVGSCGEEVRDQHERHGER